MKQRERNLWPVLFAIAMSLAGRAAEAFDWGLDARAGGIWSDNVAQAPPGPLVDSNAIGSLELNGVAEHATRSLLLDAEAAHSYRNFFSDQYDSESRSQLRASVDWMPIRDILRLSVSDTYGQLALNPSEGLLPSEYENANVFTAGPAITVPFGSDTRVIASGEYRAASFSESPVDTERRYAEVSVEHDLSRLFTLYAAGTRALVDFDIDGVSRGYRVSGARVGMDAIGRRTALAFGAGVDKLYFGGRTFTGTTFQLDLERRISRTTRVFLNARREVTDSAQVFELGQITDPALTSIRDVQVTSQPMLRAQYRAAWIWSGSRLDLNAQAGFISEKFEALPQDPLLAAGADRIVREYGVGATYHIGGSSTLGGSVEMLREHFRSGLRSNDLFGTLTYTQRLTDKVGLEVSAQRIQRTDSPRDFKELRLFAYCRYVFREPAERQRAVFDRAFERRTLRSRSPGQGQEPGGEAEE